MPDLEPTLKAFRDLVQSGIPPTKAYRRTFAAGRTISPAACCQGGARKMRKINRLNHRKVKVNPLINYPKKVIPKLYPQPVDAQIPTSPRGALLKRLWMAVQSDKNPEAVQAVRELRDWLSEDEKKAKEAQIADPAIIAGHVLAVSGDYAALDPIAKADYCRRFVDILDSLGLPRADLHVASAADRDFAPPPAQPLDSIAPNEPTPPSTLPITPPDVILS